MGASVSAQAREESALLEACAEGDAQAVNEFIQAGRVDVDCFDDEYSRPLHVAAFCGHAQIVEMILERSKGSLEAPGQLGGTPLHVACTGKRLRVVRMLIEAKACVDARDESGLRPLHRAAAAGGAEAVALLLESGASVDAATDDGHTPLHVAAMRNRAPVIRTLLSANADVSARTTDGDTPAVLLARHASDGSGAEAKALLGEVETATPPPSPPPSSIICAHNGDSRSDERFLCLPLEVMVDVLVRAGMPRAPLALAACSRSLGATLNSDATWHMLFDATYHPVVERFFRADTDLTTPATAQTWRAFTLGFAESWVTTALARHQACVIVIDERAYDVSHFIHEHPGEPQLLLAAAGRDATAAFEYVDHSSSARRILETLAVPRLDGVARVAIEAQQWRRRRATQDTSASTTTAREDDGASDDPDTRWARLWASVRVAATSVWDALAAMNEGNSMRRGTAVELLV